MKSRFLVRRIFTLLIVAITLWTVLTAVFYNFVATPVFAHIKARELLPRAKMIASRVYDESLTEAWDDDIGAISLFCIDLVANSRELFGNWSFIVNNDNTILYHTDLPTDPIGVDQALLQTVLEEHRVLHADRLEQRTSRRRLPDSDEQVIIVTVPIETREHERMGSVVAIQPIKEMGVGIQSLNFALLTSSLIVLVIMVLPVILATLRIVKPIESMCAVATAMGEGDFSQRADESQEGEMGELGRAFNTMASQLEVLFIQLRDQASQLRQIIDGIGEGLVAVDREGHITQYNDRIFSVFEIDGTDADRASAEAFLQSIRLGPLFEKAMETREKQSTDITKDLRQIQIVATPLFSQDGDVTGAVGLFRDVTQAARLEQTRRDYVANVSHELRTPLTAMRGLLEPLTDGMVTDPEDQKRYQEILLRQTMRLSRLINDMLELSRLQAGTTTIEQRPMSLIDLAREVADNYAPVIAGNGQHLETRGFDETIPDVWGNADRVEQILVILLDNAMKFTPKDGVITIGVAGRDDHADVFVADTGCGIDARDVEHVFDRFFKEDRAHQGQGTGLGLSIAREIAEQLQYRLSVESKRDVGSTFTLSIPYAHVIEALRAEDARRGREAKD